jgi:hypothetical protein
VPTYGLTDNEKTVTVEHVAGVAVRNPDVVAAARHYGLTIATCEVADPESKGGSEATVRLAKADLVPTTANLLGAYPSFGALEVACEAFCEQVNGRVHRVTRRVPVEALGEEQARLHPLPAQPFTLAFGQTRTVASTTPMIDYQTGQYSVPHQLRGEVVWVREHGEEIVVSTLGRPARSRSPGMCAPRRAAPGWTTPTSHRHPPGRPSAAHAPVLRTKRPSWRSVMAPGCG